MASVTLTAAWLHLAAAQSTYVTFDAQTVSETADRPVDVKRYAAGRLRSIVQPGVGKTIEIAALHVTRATVDTLRGWVGETVMFRDPMSRNVFGVFGALSVEEVVGFDTRPNISMQLQETTWNEEV